MPHRAVADQARVNAKMPLPGLGGAAVEQYGATPLSAGCPMPYRFNEPRRHKILRARYRGHRSLIAGWVVKPSVQRLSGDECPRRVMVLSAVGVSRRMRVSEA